MKYDFSISDDSSDFADVHADIIRFIATYGSSSAKIMSGEDIPDEDGLVFGGSYGNLTEGFYVSDIGKPRACRFSGRLSKCSAMESSCLSGFRFRMTVALTIAICLLTIGLTWTLFRLRSLKTKFDGELKRLVEREINFEAKALRAQMNPHFLFNSLNSIRLFILKNDQEKAEDYITKFSRLLRMILTNSRRESIRVYDEIQTLKLYLEFERLRFDGDFDFNISISGQDVLDFQIPPMIIQPFVENAIWHGLMPRKDSKGIVNVSFGLNNDLLEIDVQDNGIGRSKDKRKKSSPVVGEGSVGLKITKDRLRSLSRKSGTFNDYEIIDLFNEKGNSCGTLVKLYFETNNNLL